MSTFIAPTSIVYCFHVLPFQFLSQTGYVPENDIVIDSLTGRKLLSLFARLRGIPVRKRKEIVNQWLNVMGE